MNRVPTGDANGKSDAPTSPEPGGTRFIASASTPSTPVPSSSADTGGRIFISPLARRFAEERSIDYTRIRGTGPNGRIIKLDVEAALTATGTRAAQAPPPVAASTPAPTDVPFEEPAPAVDTGEVVEIPLTAMRRTIARRLSQSMQAAPHFYVTSVIRS